ncbi:MAG: hypothetical protein ACYTCU_03670 [Planctomycetota bacterium]
MLLLLAALGWGAAELIELTSLRWSEEHHEALASLGASAAELDAADEAGAQRAARLHTATLLLFAAQAVVTVGALLAARALLWRRWTRRVHDLMENHDPADKYSPVLRDIRDRVDRLAREGREGAAERAPD